MTTGPLDRIPTTVEDYRWLRGTKSWRITLRVPSDHNIPAMLTALIESRVNASIAGQVAIEISPAFVVDVPPCRGKDRGKFNLVLETCYEQQAGIGPRLTALIGQVAALSIVPETETPKASTKTTTIDAKQVSALHHSFFVNPRFQSFVHFQTGDACEGSAATTKESLKKYLGVASTRDIAPAQFNEMLAAFNGFVNARTA